MGIFRTFLAFLVVEIHTRVLLGSAVPFGGNGYVPVLGFFVLSGFYMALVLEKKYLQYPGGIKDFYINRALRIYPAYLFIVALSALLVAATGQTSFAYWTQSTADLVERFRQLAPFSQALLIIANVTTFGSNALVETGFLPTGEWTTNVKADGFIPARYFLLFPPVWTLGIELTFYALAPLLMFARWFLPLLIVVAFYIPGWLPSPQTYTGISILPGPAMSHPIVWLETVPSPFFQFFLCGMAAYFVYKHLPDILRSPRIGQALLVVLLIFGVASNALPISEQHAIDWFIYLTMISTPFLFIAFRHSKLDYIIGNFSYAVYVSHFAAHKLLTWAAGGIHHAWLYYLVLCALAVFIVYFIEQPIDRIRARRVAARRDREASAATP